MEKISVFIIGSKGYTANYGGWETFVHGLVDNWSDPSVEFFVFELAGKKSEEGFKRVGKAVCCRVYVKNTGSSTMMHYDAKCTKTAMAYVSGHHVAHPVFLYLGMRIGPLIRLQKPFMKKNGIAVIENPDGMEWKRTKWNPAVQVYLFLSARLMAGAADCLVCDSREILRIYESMPGLKKVRKTYIPYGVSMDAPLPETEPETVRAFFDRWGLKKDGYYLILGRYTPENNYEMMLKGFMGSKTIRDLLVITNYAEEKKSFHQHIRESTRYEEDARVKMAGSVYDSELVRYLRALAHAYIHGHSVGGTNPGLLEAMAVTDVNLLFDGVCNREVGKDAAVWFHDAADLAEKIEEADAFSDETIRDLGSRAKARMKEFYSWDTVVEAYDRIFHSLFS